MASPDETPILSEALRLSAAGFAVHWLKPRSKAPAAMNWSTAPVATPDDLRSTYRDGANVGLRLGEPSRTEAGYVHLLDVDIRVAEYADEAWAALEALFPSVDLKRLPSVVSGSGGESRHIYFLSSEPFSGKLLAVSEGKHRRTKVDPKTGEAKEGWSYDWEIELFGSGKQVVLPPSIHPDTRKPYVWGRPFDLGLLDFGVGPEIPTSVIAELGATSRTTYEFETREPLDFKPGQLEQELSEIEVSDLPYDDWIRLGQALHHQFGGAEAGWNLWLQHTRRSTKYDGDDRTMRKKWQSFGRYRAKPVTMATIRLWVQEARSRALVATLDDLFDDEQDAEQTPTSVLDLEFDAPTPTTITPGVGGVSLSPATYDPEWRSYLQITEEGAIKPTLHNVRLIVQNDDRLRGVFGYNLHKMRPVIVKSPGRVTRRRDRPKPLVQLEGEIWEIKDTVNGRPFLDDTVHRTSVRAVIEAPKSQGGYEMRITDRDMKGAIDMVAHDNSFHPVRDYLDRLEWDGTPRLERLWIDYLGAPDDAYHRATATLTLMAAVARVYEPGFKFDYVPVIEGRQGARKSTFVKTLAIRECWFAELGGDFHDTTQMVELMEGSWIMELPELQGFSKAEVTTIKAFVTRTTDKTRRKFGEGTGEFPRQCIIIGTTNDSAYLRDVTGGRRFWPIECKVESINIERLQTEIHQFWAEAKARYQVLTASGGGLYLQGREAIEEAMERQETRRIETPEEALAGEIEQWLGTPIAADFDDLDGEGPLVRQETCHAQIWQEMLGNEPGKLDDRNSMLIGRAMRLLHRGWVQIGRKRTRQYGQQRIYRRAEITTKDERAYL